MRRRAVSPVVAIILLILVAIAAAIVLYAWVSSLSAKAKAAGTEKTSVAYDIEAAILTVNSNYTYTSPTLNITNTTLVNITLTVRNIGSTPIENGTWTIYVINPSTNTIIPDNTSSYKFTFNKTIGVSELANATILFMNSTLYANLKPGYYYIIELHSPQGVVDTYRVKCIRVG